jgi:hypothetical protein
MAIVGGRLDYGSQRTGVFINGAHSYVTIANNIIDAGNSAEAELRGIITTYGQNTPNLEVTGNAITGWASGMYLNPGVNDASISDNAFADNGNHINVDDPDGLTISGNDFGLSQGSKIAVGAIDVSVDAEAELGLSGNTYTSDMPPLSVYPYGTDGQTILGTSGADRFRGDYGWPEDGDRVYEGRGGDDFIVGGSGADTARFNGPLNASSFNSVADVNAYAPGDQPGWTVSAGSEGTDALIGMEKVTDSVGQTFLLVGNGGYASNAAAVAAAAEGDIIIDGTADYSGDLSVMVPEAIINASEQTNVAFTVAGLDGDATAVVTFTDDSFNTVEVNLSAGATAGEADLTALDDGTVTVTIVATDSGGLTASGAGDSLDLDTTLDTPTVALTTDTGTGGDLITSDASLTFSSPAGDVTRTYSINGGTAASSYIAPTTNGTYTVAVTDTDDAGNMATASITFDLDNSAAPPTTPDLEATSDSGGADTDNITSDNTPTFSGTAEAGATVTLYEGATVLGSGTANASGNWSITSSLLADGDHIVTTKQVDVAGNVSALSGGLILTIDTAAPTAVATNVSQISLDTGANPSDFITNDSSVTVIGTYSGTLAGGEKIQVSAGDIWKDVTLLDESTWSVSGVALLPGSSTTLQTRSIDSAGNITVGDSQEYTLDTAGPTVTAFSSTTPNGHYNEGDTVQITATMSETVLAGSTFSLTLNSGATVAVTAATQGTTLSGSYTIAAGNNSADLSVTSYTTGTVTDLAGNTMAGNELPTGENLGDNSDIAVDTTVPFFTSATTATAIGENSGFGQVVYTAVATDAAAVTYSLGTGGDEAAFSINAATGAVTLTGNPNDEAQGSYSFTVVATDAAGNASSQVVTLGINDLDESAPVFTSATTATAIAENSGAGQLVYTAAATDTADVDDLSDTTAGITYSLGTGGDEAAFSINAATGAVTLTGNPNYEAKSSYSFTVVATDAAGNASSQVVTLGINDLDESAPVFTSATTATAIAENSGAGQLVYTAAATDTADVDDLSDTTAGITYSLGTGGDEAAFSINAATGAVTLTGNPNDEAQGSYSFTVVATDAAGNASSQVVTLGINDLDESAPVFTSATTATAIAENSGAGQLVYTAAATDTADVDDLSDTTAGITYSLGTGGDEAAFSINAATGAVTLTGNPNDEAQGSYSFTVVATDAAGNASSQVVTLGINDLDESAPVFTSATTATAIAENSGAGQLVYTAAATDTADVDDLSDTTAGITYSLGTGGDEAAFSINAATGAVTLTGNPNDEAQGSYSFTVVATDAAGNASSQVVTLGINDLDESAPVFTSATTATAIAENSGRGPAGLHRRRDRYRRRR